MPIPRFSGHILLTLLVAVGGGVIGIRTRVPAGALVGAMVAVAVFNITWQNGQMPSWTKYVAQILIGAIVGLRIRPEFLGELKQLVVPALILAVGMMAWAVVLGILIHKISGIDIVTALFSTSPGGLSDMTIIAQAAGADTPKVVILHLTRLVTVIAVFPWIIRAVYRIMTKGG
ncbi:MAG: AbrB family transcriptional regulator [Spirochaeta sp.]|nr:AbrB family transcriptional regulator [Spirochaeta sp.]